MDKVRGENKGKKYDEDVAHSSESSDAYVNGIHFKHNEEEMMNGFDEGFNERFNEGFSLG